MQTVCDIEFTGTLCMYLRLLTHVKVSVRCIFKGWPIQSFSVDITSLLSLFSYSKAIN